MNFSGLRRTIYITLDLSPTKVSDPMSKLTTTNVAIYGRKILIGGA